MKGDNKAIQLLFAAAKDFKLNEKQELVPAWTDEMFEQLTIEELDWFVKLEEKKTAMVAAPNTPAPATKH